MTQFEYIAIAYSMVISFTVLRALSVLPHAVEGGRRYWVHTTWICLTLVTTLGMFWSFWLYREIAWTLPRFTLVLANPAILYVFVSLLAPADPSGTESWREHFSSIRLRLFLTGIAWDLSGLTENFVFLDLPVFHLSNIQLGLATLAHLVGAASKRAGVQSAVVLVAFVSTALMFVGAIPSDPSVSTLP
jgi:hypothetical protein